jgi:hypothetical protein
MELTFDMPRAAVNTSSDPKPARDDLAPPDFFDPVIEAYKKDVDRTLLRENLKLTVEQRLLKAESFHASADEWRKAGRRAPNQS